VPRFGNLGANQSFCAIGVLARAAADVALALSAMSGTDASDPASLAYPDPVGPPARERLHGLRVGWIGGDAGAAAGQALDACRRIGGPWGWQIRPLAWPPAHAAEDFQTISDCDRHALLVGSGRLSVEALARVSPAVRQRLQSAGRISGTRYAQALEGRRRFIAALLTLRREVDVLAQATSPHVAPLLADAAGGAREALGRLWWTNFAGCCAASVPAGRLDGLPLGLHLAAAPGADELLLAVCEAAEAVLPVVQAAGAGPQPAGPRPIRA